MSLYKQEGYPDKAGLNQRLRSSAKLAIVWLALRGMLPYRVADCLIQRGGLAHD